jgi:hypothetical protein
LIFILCFFCFVSKNQYHQSCSLTLLAAFFSSAFAVASKSAPTSVGTSSSPPAAAPAAARRRTARATKETLHALHALRELLHLLVAELRQNVGHQLLDRLGLRVARHHIRVRLNRRLQLRVAEVDDLVILAKQVHFVDALQRLHAKALQSLLKLFVIRNLKQSNLN